MTFRDLENCVDAFDQLVCKYLKLTTGTGPGTLEPTILDNWEKIFTVPLNIRANRTSARKGSGDRTQ